MSPPTKKPLLEQPAHSGAPPTPFSSQSEKLNGVIDSLREQIAQSESNLSAQFQTIMQQQQVNKNNNYNNNIKIE